MTVSETAVTGWTGRAGRPHEARVRACPACNGTGLVPRSRREVTAEMVALRRAGMPAHRIAARYGISRQALHERLRNGGYVPSKRGRPPVSEAFKMEVLTVFESAPKLEGMVALRLVYPHLAESTLRAYLTAARRIREGSQG